MTGNGKHFNIDYRKYPVRTIVRSVRRVNTTVCPFGGNSINYKTYPVRNRVSGVTHVHSKWNIINSDHSLNNFYPAYYHENYCPFRGPACYTFVYTNAYAEWFPR